MQSRAVGEPRPGSPVLCPCDRTVADVRLALLGIRLPFAVLGDVTAGEPPRDGRVRIPATGDEISKALAVGEVVVGDCESTPVALVTELTSAPLTSGSASLTASDGSGWIEGLLSPVGEVAAALPVRKGETRVVVCPARPLAEVDVEGVRGLGADDVVLVVPASGTSPDGLPTKVMRQCLELVAPEEFIVLPLPVSWRGTAVDEALAWSITTGLEGTQLSRPRSAAETLSGSGGARSADDADGRQLGSGVGASGAGGALPSADALWVEVLGRLREATNELAGSADVLLAKVIPVLSRWRPPRRERGLVVFFTGFSGSGKSTLAKGLADYLTGHVDRTVTLLDGDVVRRMLSSGLGFDRAGRDLNVRRIGFVAAEVARHGGIAVCAPIAPYAESRAAVREMVEAVGDLVLVHVATPLEECERRDTKGLYKKARAGLVTQFTGISDPYDEPLDAELRVDTSGAALEDSLAVITDHLTAGGWLPTTHPEG